MDLSSCRICLSPSLKFISIFGKFHGRSVKEIVEDLASINIQRSLKLPKYVCEQCLTSLLHAESIVAVCRKNNDFLNELASIEETRDDLDKSLMIVEVLSEDKR
jgi:hypothetical protein